MNKIIILISFSLLPVLGIAQVEWESAKGAIKSEEIVIEKDKQLVLPKVSRRFTSITINPLVIDTSANVYVPKEVKVDLPKIPVKLRPRTMKSEALDKTYWGNFKLGYGSYVSPLVQADIASKRNDEYAIAAHFRHFSSKNGPIDNRNSGLSNTDGYISGKVFLNKVTFGGQLGADFDKYHLYGYDLNAPIPESKDIEQKLANYSVAFNVVDNNTKNDLYYRINLGSHFFNASNLIWKENDFFANIRTDLTSAEHLKIKLLGDFHLASQNYAITTNARLFYKIKPIASYMLDAFDFEIGAGIYGTKDSINNFQHKIYVTPHIVANYNFSSGRKVSAGIKGDVKWQSARMRFNENHYMGATAVLNNTVKPLELFVEGVGKLAPKVDFIIGYNASLYKVFGQYLNNVTDQSTFYIDYQEEKNLIHTFNGQLDFITSKNLLFSVYGKYLIFDFKSLDNAYHLPKVDLGLKAKLALEDKMVAEFSLSYLDGIYALDNVTGSDLKLNSILDMNIAASYKINTNFSVFAKMQNLLGNKYQYYLNYPTKGFQALVGLSFTL